MTQEGFSEKGKLELDSSFMFDFELPFGSHTRSYFDESGQIRFDPPVYEQRYAIALRILEHDLFVDHVSSVIDFGTAEMAMIPLLKQVQNIEKVVAVDIDRKILETHLERGKPYISDYIKTRSKPFTVEVYEGSIDQPDSRMIGIDAIIAIEIIEHVFPETLNNIPFNIFGFIQPKIVVMSTPNSEFNVLFDLPLSNGFRHHDHKFEWTREQFTDWCFNICTRFPNYLVHFLEAGVAPPDHRKLGPVSQIALFARKDILEMELIDSLVKHNFDGKRYKVVNIEEYPFQVDKRTNHEKALDEAKYHINRFRRMEIYLNKEKKVVQIPLIAVYEFVENLVNNSRELIEILLNDGICLQDDFIIVEMEEEDEWDERFLDMDSLYDFEVYDHTGSYDDDCDNEDATEDIEKDLEKLNLEEESWD